MCPVCRQSCLRSTCRNAQETAEPRLAASSRPHGTVEKLWPSRGGDGSGGGFQPWGHSQGKDLQRLGSYSSFRARNKGLIAPHRNGQVPQGRGAAQHSREISSTGEGVDASSSASCPNSSIQCKRPRHPLPRVTRERREPVCPPQTKAHKSTP